MKRLIALTLLLTSSAHAEEVVYVTPVIPDEATKREALMMGYIANGNSMVGDFKGSLDLTEQTKCLMLLPTPLGPRDPYRLDVCRDGIQELPPAKPAPSKGGRK
jgi:hypothetical protein